MQTWTCPRDAKWHTILSSRLATSLKAVYEECIALSSGLVNPQTLFKGTGGGNVYEGRYNLPAWKCGRVSERSACTLSLKDGSTLDARHAASACRRVDK